MDNSKIPATPEVGDLITVPNRTWIGYVTRLVWENGYEYCWIKWSDPTGPVIKNFQSEVIRKIKNGCWKLIKSLEIGDLIIVKSLMSKCLDFVGYIIRVEPEGITVKWHDIGNKDYQWGDVAKRQRETWTIQKCHRSAT